jgi:predicted ester cyclase
MSPEENKAIVHRYLDEVWNKKNRAIIDEVIAPDLVQHIRNVPPGRDGIHRFFAMMDLAFPNAHMVIEDMLAEGDKVMWRFTIHATHTGPFRDIQPTGNAITLTGMAMTRMRDGQMVENWNQTDDLGMMQQLGAIPSPGG